MNQPNAIPIEFYAGETYAPSTISWIDSDSNPINLSGYSAQLQARQTVGSIDPPEILVSSTTGGIILGGTLGTINIVISSAITGTIPAPWYGFWDMFVYSPSGVATRLIGGTIQVKQPVTRA